MIIYNENKELILKDNFREFHLVNSGFGFIQKTQLRILKKLFSSFEESENDTENLKAAYHALKEEVKKTSVYREAACRCVSRKLDSLLPKEKEFINKKAFIDIVKFEKRFLHNLTNGFFDLITSGPIALVYAADERIVFDGIEKRESTFKGLAESFENPGNRYFSVDTKKFKNMVKIYNDIPISLNENLAINPKLFKNIVKFFNFTKQKTIHCCISADCLRVKFWNDSFILILCPFDFKAENPESLNFYGFTELAENPSADPRALPSLLPLPSNPVLKEEIPAADIAAETEAKEIAESENCVNEENHNPDNCAKIAESGIISAENGNIFSFYSTQRPFLVLIYRLAWCLHSSRVCLLYMHLSACFQIAKWIRFCKGKKMEKKKEKYVFETRVNGDYGCIVCRSKKEALKYFEAEETGMDPGDYKAVYKTVCFYDGSWNPVYPLNDFNALIWLERSESGQVEKIA